MNTHQWYLNGLKPISLTAPNTFIGGVASTLGTAQLLATKLAIDVSRITCFTVVGSDIQCRISGSYSIPSWQNDTLLTYYDDKESLVNGITIFKGCTNFKGTSSLNGVLEFKNCLQTNGSFLIDGAEIYNVRLKNCIQLAGNTFDGYDINVSPKKIFIPRAIRLGASAINNTVFAYMHPLSIIYAHPSLATSQGGAEEGDIAAARTAGLTIVYVTGNDIAPNAPTNITVNNYNSKAQLNFTQAINDNQIAFYKVYVNGVFTNEITASGGFVTNLQKATSYQVELLAVDIALNESAKSVAFTVTTTNYAYETDAQSAIATVGITEEFQKEAVHTIISKLKTDGIWTKLKILNLRVGNTASQQKWNYKDLRDLDVAFRYVYNGSWRHDNKGARTLATSYANTFLNLSAQGMNGNFALGNYVTERHLNFGDKHSIGAWSTTNNWVSFDHQNDIRVRAYGNPYTSLPFVKTYQAGFIAMSINGTVLKAFHEDRMVTGVTAGTSVPTVNLWEGCLNYNNTAYGATRATYGTSFVSLGLTDTEMTNLKNAVTQFETDMFRVRLSMN